jgi:hypothetical protein
MRAIRLRLCAAFVLLAIPPITAVRATPAPTAGKAIQAEAMADRWQGRRNYLYDDNHPPGADTVGQRPSDARGCVNEPVRMRRSDGSTVVRRFQRCD